MILQGGENMKADKRLIVALDVHAMPEMRGLVARLGDSAGYYKVGMELFYSVGAEAIRYLRQAGKDVFLDLKLHDIPNTVAHSARVLTRLGVTMFNVHAAGGTKMMKAAAEAVAEEAAALHIEKPRLIAVTVLTSLDGSEWESLNHRLPIAEQVVSLAKLAKASGLDGVVASPQEAAAVRAACGPDFLIVTPGVRPRGAEQGDQSRTATPGGALKDGASHLVVGRPITKADNPVAAVEMILREMEVAFS